MTDRDLATPPERRGADDSAEFVQTVATSGTVRLRRGTAQAFSWTRLGVILAIAVLLAAAAYIARTPLAAGDASASDDPNPTTSQVADASVAPSSFESPASPEPTATAPTDESSAPTDVVEPSEEPSEEPAWTPRIWSFDPDARFETSVELTSSCLLDKEGWEVPPAQVIFEITWDGDVPLASIEFVIDGAREGGYGTDLAVSGTFGHGMIATAAEPHVETIRFYADTEEIGPGPIVKVIDTPFEVDPTEPCY